MSVFRFQQFALVQQQSAMKVCTDSLVFGAYADVDAASKLLDIGTGTGLLALMAAQRGATSITAVELCVDAAQEARMNVRNSPWSETIQVVQTSIQVFTQQVAGVFDTIICNPPFFSQHLGSPNHKRHRARHNDGLNLDELIGVISQLLGEDGTAHLLLPVHAKTNLLNLLAGVDLWVAEIMLVYSFALARAKVMIVKLDRKNQPMSEKILTVYTGDRCYTQEAEALLKPFLLRFCTS